MYVFMNALRLEPISDNIDKVIKILPHSIPQVPNPSSGLMDYATNMRPEYHQAIIDLIHYYQWDHIIYLYDSHDGEYHSLPLRRGVGRRRSRSRKEEEKEVDWEGRNL